MKKTRILQKIVPVVCMVVLISVGCAGTSGTESSSIKGATAETVQPTATAGSNVKQESADMDSEEASEDIRYRDKKGYWHYDNTKWYYDKKNKRLIISGTGEMFDNPDAEWLADGCRPDSIYPNHTPISKVQKNAKEIVVESGITSIGIGTFFDFSQVERITLPDTLQKLGEGVFWECESLKEIVFPRRMKIIGAHCFFGCKSLQKITLGKSVEEIDEGAFADCPNIREVKVSPQSKYFVIKNGGLYQKKEKTLSLHFAKSERVKIEKGTKRIADFALQWNENIKQIAIPASVRTIGGAAMFHCSNLEKVVFSKNSQLKEIEKYGWFTPCVYGVDGCFEGCEKLQEFISPESLERMGYDTFYGCDSLERIYLGKNFKGYPREEEYDEEREPWYSREYEFTEKGCSLKEYIVSKDNEVFCSKEGVLYDKKMETLFVYPIQKDAVKYTIPESVTCVWYIAEKGSKLRKLVIPGKDTAFCHVGIPHKSKQLTIYGRKDSAAYRVAKKRKIKFVEM